LANPSLSLVCSEVSEAKGPLPVVKNYQSRRYIKPQDVNQEEQRESIEHEQDPGDDPLIASLSNRGNGETNSKHGENGNEDAEERVFWKQAQEKQR
jgi:hypothetical protein